MISLSFVVFIFIIFFALAGMVRGMAKEIVAMAGLVLALFIIQFFSRFGLTPGSLIVPDGVVTDPGIHRQQFWVFTLLFLFIGFFSYQGPSLTTGGKLSRQERVQDRLLGFILGGINGWLMTGSIISFLEFHLKNVGGTAIFERLPAGNPYPIEGLQRAGDTFSSLLYAYLPLTLFPSNLVLLVLVMVVLFLVVLIVII